MNAIIRRTLLVLCVVPFHAVAAEPPITGKVLLVDYDRILEGDVERIENRYRLRLGSGEMTIPARPGIVLLSDREAAYRAVRTRARLDDPLERVRLARWCQSNQFLKHALEEAEAAATLRPDDKAFARFRDEMKTQVSLAPPPSVTTPAPAAKLPAIDSSPVDVKPESYSLFVGKVQPILMNLCAKCHAGESAGSFRLVHADSTNILGTQSNLKMVSTFVNKDQPAESLLLLRATSVHGQSGRPPLKDRQAPAFKHLEDWVSQATGRPIVTPIPTAPAPLPADVAADAEPLPIVELPILPMKVVPKPSPEKSTLPDRPEKPMPVDPFDPEQFNQKKKEPPKK